MPFVNYVREHNAFIEYAADNGLRPNEILVWESLFHIMNQRANGNYWPDGFIRVKNDRLLTYAPIGFDSLSRARNALAQRGLISYKPGKRNSDIPMYELHYLTAVGNPQLHDAPVENPVDNSFYTGCCPQFADNIRDNMQGNMGYNMGDNMRGNMGYQYINLNQKETEQNKTYVDDDAEDDDASRGRARAYDRCFGREVDDDAEEDAKKKRLQDAASRAILKYFGRKATTAEADAIARVAKNDGLSPEMIDIAVERAARHGARIPVSYLHQIFDEWRYQEVKTPEEAAEYQFLDDAATHRNGNHYGSGDITEDFRRISEAREERKRRHEEAGGA